MIASDILIEALKGFEGCRLKAYKDAGAGIWTIGYGHTGKDVHCGQVISLAEAERLLRGDLARFERFVTGLAVCQSQGQFDALVDFAYNVGCGNLSSSTLLKYIRAHKSNQEIMAQFRRWNKAGGKVLPGLTKRREWEAQRWCN